ncbi:hypothetical protein QBC35DRAFT_486703 [Podospora australis]|uniref:Uncharacterized protein n=1 Tax=Podospora australis TaxID=1536484 RepID=A0AAN7AMK5_9PEZI|nr:hypothetical protein QBC35DRAFT_486703 [Podospora australis]
MSYGTTRPRRKASAEEDPNIIPRTAPLGFLGRLPFNIVGSLRYKPSAANLKEHPGGGKDGLLGGGTGGGGGGSGGETAEHEPLLGGSNGDDMRRYTSSPQQQSSARPRSNTTESGDTSSSYRSRGDLFPSDGEGDEDAVPLDEDEFTVALNRVDDRSSNRTRSSKGKRPDKDKGLSRTVSRTTMNSVYTLDSANNNNNSNNNLASSPFPTYDDDAPEVPVPSLEDLQKEEERARREEDEEIERRRRAASQLAQQRGLDAKDDDLGDDFVEVQRGETAQTPKGEALTEIRQSIPAAAAEEHDGEDFTSITSLETKKVMIQDIGNGAAFIPARLPHFT